MKRQIVKTTLFDSRLTEHDWNSFKSNMEHSKFKGQKCMITGWLGLRYGLLYGSHEIPPVLCNDIMEAIEHCLDCDYQTGYEIILENGRVEVRVYHHDGTHEGSSCFEIWLLSKKGLKEIERPKYECEDYNPNRTWFKNIYGWLY